MGTTAEKLTYLNETKTQLKDMLNLGGASLTTEPFRQYVDTLKNRYLYFMNNGTQEVWDNWDKVNGTGETLTLNNTEEAPMNLVYKGNTLQDGTPTPDNPIPIQVVSGDNSIEVSNANLFDKEYYSNSSLYSIDGAYKNTLTKIEGNRKLYSKCILKEGKTPISNLYMCICSEKHPNVSGAKPLWLVNGSVVSQSSFNFTGYNNLYFTFYPSSLTPTQIFDTYNIMVSTNDVDYVEYKGTSYPISLGDIELCKIGTYQDSIIKDNGKWYLNKQIGKVVLDGSEDWTDWTITGDHPEYITGYLLDNYINYNSSSGSDIRGVCNNFKVYSNAWVYAQSLGLRQVGDSLKRFYVAIDKNIASTLEDYKTWLGTHNTIVYYVLATPTYTLIEDSTLIEELESMKKSYENQTNISQENNDMPFILDITALSKE